MKYTKKEGNIEYRQIMRRVMEKRIMQNGKRISKSSISRVYVRDINLN